MDASNENRNLQRKGPESASGGRVLYKGAENRAEPNASREERERQGASEERRTVDVNPKPDRPVGVGERPDERRKPLPEPAPIEVGQGESGASNPESGAVSPVGLSVETGAHNTSGNRQGKRLPGSLEGK